MAVLKEYDESKQQWQGVGAGYIANVDGSNKYTPDNIKQIDENLKTHKADYAYQTPTIVGTQIRISKQSNTDRLYFKLDNTLIGSSITISLDEGISELPLKDVEGNNVTELEKGFVEVVAEATFFTLRPKGGKKIDDVDYTITSQGGQFVIPKGLHSGNGIVKAQFANLVPENVKKGVNVGGVVGIFDKKPINVWHHEYENADEGKDRIVVINKPSIVAGTFSNAIRVAWYFDLVNSPQILFSTGNSSNSFYPRTTKDTVIAYMSKYPTAGENLFVFELE